MKIQHFAFLAALVAATTMCGGSGGGSPTAPGGNTGGNGNNPYGDPGTTPPACTPSATKVCLTTSNTFSPSSITIAKGTTLSWDNETGTTHNVTFSTAGAPGNIPNFANGVQSLTFPTAGTFAYNCTIHGISMSGTVVVQ